MPAFTSLISLFYFIIIFTVVTVVFWLKRLPVLLFSILPYTYFTVVAKVVTVVLFFCSAFGYGSISAISSVR